MGFLILEILGISSLLFTFGLFFIVFYILLYKPHFLMIFLVKFFHKKILSKSQIRMNFF